MSDREYFIGTLLECNVYIAKLNVLLGYPSVPNKTTTYAIPREHLKEAGVYFMPLKRVYAPRLSSNITLEELDDKMSSVQKLNKKTFTLLKSEGGFDSEDGGEI